MKPRSFKTRDDFREWLAKNHASEKELMLRLFKVHAKHKGMGYRDALDEALCYGWIDGVAKSLDEDSYTQRFTPRRKKSRWSVVNINRAKELIAEGRMRPPGLAAFEARTAIAVAPYSYEAEQMKLDPAFVKLLRGNKGAWAFYQSQAPSYRRTATFWIMSAKREETRKRRFGEIFERCVKGQRFGVLEK